jgi:hypothetical protein
MKTIRNIQFTELLKAIGSAMIFYMILMFSVLLFGI